MSKITDFGVETVDQIHARLNRWLEEKDKEIADLKNEICRSAKLIGCTSCGWIGDSLEGMKCPSCGTVSEPYCKAFEKLVKERGEIYKDFELVKRFVSEAERCCRDDSFTSMFHIMCGELRKLITEREERK